MMKMVGFNEIYQSKCFNKENYNKNNIRLAVLAKKNKTDFEGIYRDEYKYGEASNFKLN